MAAPVETTGTPFITTNRCIVCVLVLLSLSVRYAAYHHLICQKFILMLTHLLLGLPSGRFGRSFTTKILYAFLVSLILHFTVLTVLGNIYTLTIGGGYAGIARSVQ